jgi:hypothetical protein
MKAERLDTGGQWPLSWRLQVSREPLGAEQRRRLLETAQRELRSIDEYHFEGALTDKEWDALVDGLDKTLKRKLVLSKSDKAGALQSLLKPLELIGVVVAGKKTISSVERITASVLNPLNKPMTGKFTRRIEWVLIETPTRDAVELRLVPREGFAVWLVDEKVRIVKARAENARPKSMSEKADAMMQTGRKSMAVQVAVVQGIAAEYAATWNAAPGGAGEARAGEARSGGALAVSEGPAPGAGRGLE